MPESAATPGMNCSCWIRKQGGTAAHHDDTALQAANAPASLRARLVEMTAHLCAARGYRRIALYGAGKHTEAILPGPWAAAGTTVIAVLDDAPNVHQIAGIPVLKPDAFLDPIDAVIASSDRFEQKIAARARQVFAHRGIPVLTIYRE